MLGMWGDGASSMDVSKESGVPLQGRSAASEKGSVHGMQGGEPHHKEL